MPSHRMHLRGPWNYRCLSAVPESLSSSGKVQLPATWELCFADWLGTVEFSRRFHAPTNLDPEESVAVVFTGVGGRGTVWVNDQPLGSLLSSPETQRFEIRPWLQPSNLLRVELSCTAELSSTPLDSLRLGLWGLIGIEVSS